MIDLNNIDMNDLKAHAQSIGRSSSGSVMENVPEGKVVNLVLNDIVKVSKSTEPKDVLLGVANILQKGGTSPKMPQNTKVVFGNTTITKAMIADSCKKNNITPRQLARGMADIIGEIATELNWPGNQAKNYKLENPHATANEIAYAADFQSFNSNAPEGVRNWLAANFKERFGDRKKITN